MFSSLPLVQAGATNLLTETEWLVRRHQPTKCRKAHSCDHDPSNVKHVLNHFNGHHHIRTIMCIIWIGVIIGGVSGLHLFFRHQHSWWMNLWEEISLLQFTLWLFNSCCIIEMPLLCSAEQLLLVGEECLRLHHHHPGRTTVHHRAHGLSMTLSWGSIIAKKAIPLSVQYPVTCHDRRR